MKIRAKLYFNYKERVPNWRENADQSALARFPPLNYRLTGCFQAPRAVGRQRRQPAGDVYIGHDVKLIQFNTNQVLCKRRVVELSNKRYIVEKFSIEPSDAKEVNQPVVNFRS
jgi:hypothetical protein